ncbi:MAG: staygreen family protein [Bacillus sp. (in: firmicutes)]
MLVICNESKIAAKFLFPATILAPLLGRKYTMTHSDETGDLFVSIGCIYDYPMLTKKRDEVLANWNIRHDQYILQGFVYVTGGEFSEEMANVRYNIFKREMETALKSIMFADQTFFLQYPFLLDAPIYIHFYSTLPLYNQVLYFGTPRMYFEEICRKSAV